MADRLLVSTRKGLFNVERGASGWRVGRVSFLAENVTLAHADPRDGGLFAALNLGHFGVKLKHSPDGGETWTERAAPAYPEGATVATGDGMALQQYPHWLEQEYGLYFKVARLFAQVIGQPALMRELTRVGMRSRISAT